MMERRQIVKLWKRGDAGPLITLVRVEGSSYRQPGARLLLGSARHAGSAGHLGSGEATYAGTISGGCLEAAVVRKAAWFTRDGAATERYAMSFDDTAEIPFGLGCGGTVTLLFERLDTPEGEALMHALETALDGDESTVITFLPGGGRTLRRLVLRTSGPRAGETLFASTGLSPEKIACARLLVPGESYEGRFVERLSAPQKLYVVGAGDDAKPLVRMASLLGWSVIVADGRSQLARAERFPEAERVVLLAPHGFWDGALACGQNDAVVLMSHSYEQDRDALTAMIPRAPRYLGLLGSRHRSSLLISEAAAALGRSVESCCAGIFAPVGLHLGGDGPEAIALAVVAEIQAICNGLGGNAGRLSASQVRTYVEQGDRARYLQTQCALENAS